MAQNPNIPSRSTEGILVSRFKKVVDVIGNLALGTIGIAASLLAFTETASDFDAAVTLPFDGPDFE